MTENENIRTEFENQTHFLIFLSPIGYRRDLGRSGVMGGMVQIFGTPKCWHTKCWHAQAPARSATIDRCHEPRV